MLGKKGKEVVSIPLPQIDIPHFRFGNKQTGGVGAGRRRSRRSARAGTAAAGRRQGGRSAGRASARGRRHDGGAGADPRRGAAAAAHRAEGQRAHRRAQRSLHRHAQYRARVAATFPAHVQAGAPAADRVGHVQSEESADRAGARGQALSLVAIRSAAAVERRHHLHDGRVGLDGRRAKRDRAHRELLDRYLAALAISGHREPLHHPRRDGQRGRSRDLLPHARDRAAR